MLAADVLADLNGTSSSPNLAPGSITKSMLAAEVLADLNASSASDGAGSSTAFVPAGNLVALPAGQSAPAGYSLHQPGERNKNLVWEEKAPVSVARAAYDGVKVLDGKIYFVGGYAQTAKNIAERYDPSTNQWETIAAMTSTREGLSAAVLNGKPMPSVEGIHPAQFFQPWKYMILRLTSGQRDRFAKRGLGFCNYF